jgi:TatD DNase family protein
MKYFDSHAHYYDERFSEEMTMGVDDFIDTLLTEKVSYIINIGASPETSRLVVAQAKKHKNMYSAVGIHPSDTRFLNDIEKDLADIRDLILDKENKVVCLGEIGLDYHYPETDKEKQLVYFERQMQMAEELGIPVCIHDRESHADVMEVIRRFPNVKGVLHSFSGSVEMAEELVELGWMISFSGTLTFTNARRPKEVAAVLPHESVMIETDCPYLAPHPKRGSLNHSGNLEYTNGVLAEIWGISPEECARITEQNAKRFFRL